MILRAAAIAWLAVAARAGVAPLQELEQILASKNDNDPRLDRDFNALSLEAKRLFRKKYFTLTPEKRNERGTIVYLLGRNLKTADDWAFLKAVAAEPPCLSLADCSKKSAVAPEAGDEVTLAYPSLVALEQAARALEKDRTSKQARAVVDAGLASQAPAVVRKARRILARGP